MAIDLVTVEVGDDVELQAELAHPAQPRAALVMAHPHPRYGGDMHSPVVTAVFQALPAEAVAVLRFNFRGVGRSTGSFDDGAGERLDVAAALAALATAVPGVPLVVGGYSFGADMAADVGGGAAAGWFLVAAPLGVAKPGAVPAAGVDNRPTLLAVPEHDQFRSPASAQEATAGWRGTRIAVVRSADHFLLGATTTVAKMAAGLVKELLGASPPR